MPIMCLVVAGGGTSKAEVPPPGLIQTNYSGTTKRKLMKLPPKSFSVLIFQL